VNEAILVAIVTAAINGAVTWGIINTKLAWLRHDISRLEARINASEMMHHQPRRNHE
jgi:hypothetical protein